MICGNPSFFEGISVLVVGDAMVDHYIMGKATRISPEAPVPVVSVLSEEYRPGGAANVAANIAAMGGTPSLLALRGEDTTGSWLERNLRERGVRPFLLPLPQRPTIRKVRVLATPQQIVRIDWDTWEPLSESQEAQYLALLDEAGKEAKAVVLSDYAKGAITSRVAKSVVEWAKSRSIPVIVDPKPPHKKRYTGATLITPNRAEAERLCGCEFRDQRTLELAAEKLRRDLSLKAVLVTQGGEGMTLVEEEGAFHIPARAFEVYDVSGAGDTVVAVVSLAYGSGWPLKAACELANLAGGIVVQKRGTAAVACAELVSHPEWPSVVMQLKEAGVDVRIESAR